MSFFAKSALALGFVSLVAADECNGVDQMGLTLPADVCMNVVLSGMEYSHEYTCDDDDMGLYSVYIGADCSGDAFSTNSTDEMGLNMTCGATDCDYAMVTSYSFNDTGTTMSPWTTMSGYTTTRSYSTTNSGTTSSGTTSSGTTSSGTTSSGTTSSGTTSSGTTTTNSGTTTTNSGTTTTNSGTTTTTNSGTTTTTNSGTTTTNSGSTTETTDMMWTTEMWTTEEMWSWTTMDMGTTEDIDCDDYDFPNSMEYAVATGGCTLFNGTFYADITCHEDSLYFAIWNGTSTCDNDDTIVAAFPLEMGGDCEEATCDNSVATTSDPSGTTSDSDDTTENPNGDGNSAASMDHLVALCFALIALVAGN